MTTAGFEPAKHDAQDLKSRPVDQTRERCLIAFYIKKDFIHDGIWTRNPQIRSLVRYPIALHGQTMNIFQFIVKSNFLEKYDLFTSSGAWTRDLGLIRPAL